MQRKKAAAREKKDLCGGKRGCREGGGSARRRRGLYRENFIKNPLIFLRGKVVIPPCVSVISTKRSAWRNL